MLKPPSPPGLLKSPLISSSFFSFLRNESQIMTLSSRMINRSDLSYWSGRRITIMVKAGWDFGFLLSHMKIMNCAPRKHIWMSVKNMSHMLQLLWSKRFELSDIFLLLLPLWFLSAKAWNDFFPLQTVHTIINEIYISTTFLRPFHHGGEVTEARVREADRVCSGHDQNLR